MNDFTMGNESDVWREDDFNASAELWDPFEDLYHHEPTYIALGALFIIAIIVSGTTNVLGLASLVRYRMWLRHEGYFYVVTMFATNVGIVLFDSSSFCITHWNYGHYPPDSSEFLCRVWHFLMSIYFALGWLSVALVMNIYLREHLVHRRRCGCPVFAARYCTLFASKIVVGVVFGLVLILGLPSLGLFTLRGDDTYGYHCGPTSVAFHILLLVEFCLMWALPFVFFMPVVLLLVLCLSSEGQQFGFSQIEARPVGEEHFRTMAATLASINLFSQFSMASTYFLGFGPFETITTVIRVVFTLALGLQPVICLIIVREHRAEVLQSLRSIDCCNRLFRKCLSTGDPEGVRMQDMEETSDSP